MVLQMLLDPTDFDNLPKNYEICVKNLENLLENILKDLPTKKAKKFEKNFILELSKFENLIHVKNSLIVMSGLNPSLFEFLFQRLHLTDPDLIQASPMVHLSILTMSKKFAITHEYFYSSSNLIGPSSDFSFVSEFSTSKFFGIILSTMIALMKMAPMLQKDVLAELLNMISGIFEFSSDLTVSDSDLVYEFKKELVFLTFEVADKNYALRRVYENISKKLNLTDFLPKDKSARSKNFWSTFFEKFNKLGESLQRNFYYIFPQTCLLWTNLNGYSLSLFDKKQVVVENSGMLQHEFTVLANFLFNFEVSPVFSRRETIIKSFEHLLIDVLKIPESEKWRILMNRLALCCIENKMKTIYGKPIDTFTVFETAIRNILEKSTSSQLSYQFLPENEECDDGEADIFEKRKLLPSEEFLRVNCLLTFVDLLDKLMVYAERGSIVEFSKISESSRQFFVNNATSCQAWIAKITVPMLQVCYRAGRYGQVVRLASAFCFNVKQRSEKLKTTIKYDENVQAILGWLIKALIELNAPSSIAGVNTFAKKVFGVNLIISYPAEYLACGKYEAAKQSLFLFAEAGGLNEFEKEFFLELIRSKKFKIYENRDINSTIEKTLQLLGASNIHDETDKFEITSLPWEIEKRIDDFEKKFMDILSQMEKSKKGQKYGKIDALLKKPFEEMIKKISFEIQRYSFIMNSVDICPKIKVKFSLLDALKRAISLKLNDGGYKNGTNLKKEAENCLDFTEILEEEWKLETVKKLEVATQLDSWLTKIAKPKNDVLMKLQQFLIKFTRKTDNFEISKFYLEQMERMVKMNEPGQFFPNGMVHLNGPPFLYGQQMFPPPPPFVMPILSPNGYGFIPAMPPQMSPIPNIPQISNEMCEIMIEKAKLGRITDDKPEIKISSFFNLSNIITTQNLVFLSPSSSPAPGMIRNDDEFHEKLIQIKKLCLKLGKWSENTTEIVPKIMDRSKFKPNIFWDMIIKRFNILNDCCGELTNEKIMSGSFYWLSTEIGNNLCGKEIDYSKSHQKLTEWATEQLYEKGELLLKLTENEMQKFKEYEIDLNDPKMKQIWKILTITDDLNEFRKKIVDLVKIKDATVFLSHEFETMFKTIKERQITLYDIALKGYIHYLTQLGNSKESSTIYTVSSTLHILQMLVNRPDLFEKCTNGLWLTQMNERIWKDIIPQLFARLNHPNIKVRNAICNLLGKIGKSSPHAICFPAIVGAYFSKPIFLSTEPSSENENNFETEIDETVDLTNDYEQDQTLMSTSCLLLVENISKHYPKLVEDVTKFIKELQRINMLHEEKWAFVLTNLDIEMNKRIHQIQNENENILSTKHLTEEEKIELNLQRADLLTGNIRQILNDLFNFTCTASDNLSINEKQFQEVFKDEIHDAFLHFDEHRINDPKYAWEPFKKLVTTLNQRASKKSSLSLLTSEMSPYLATMENTAIPIPGQELNEEKIVTIAKMKENVSILLTKTRPKKITFIGNDGKEYVFLFKGQEDLHLDERVMQLLHICNLMLSNKKEIKQNDGWPKYYSQNYSVTPLGIRSGLIRWIDGATPLFQIYRKWKTRQMSMEKKGTDEKTNNVDPERPMEMFVKQLQATFNENNTPNDVRYDRKRWPVSILKQVLEKLIDSTPRDILSKELWMNAGNSESWWKLTQQFARSTAVASIVGSIIGLGDRHMENLLVNLSTGDVIHIDYNICFDKGRQLRVPETVPFRLTGNIIYALGPTQIEGTFRHSCEHVLTVLRNGKETLLAMLDAFVYDPLVDWAMQDQMVSSLVNIGTILAVYGTDDKSLAGKKFSLALFQLRLKENSSPWISAAKQLEDVLTKAVYQLGKIKTGKDFILKIKNGNDVITDLIKKLHKCMKDHYSISTRFRPLIKTLAHYDERFRNYLKEYSEKLSDPLAKGFKMLNEEDIDIDKCCETLKFCVEHMFEVYNGLLQLGQITDLKNGTTNDDKTNGEIQKFEEEEENLHAKMISKRIRRRLEGREHLQNMSDISTLGDMNKILRRHTIDAPMCIEGKEMMPNEQVEMLISCATNPNNLAFMYEGWTSWV